MSTSESDSPQPSEERRKATSSSWRWPPPSTPRPVPAASQQWYWIHGGVLVMDELVLPFRTLRDLVAAAGVLREEVVVITQGSSLGAVPSWCSTWPHSVTSGLSSSSSKRLPRTVPPPPLPPHSCISFRYAD